MTRGVERGMAPTVSHVIAIGITTIVVVGLLVTANSVYTSQSETAIREELEIIGNRLADEVSRAASLAASGGTVSIESTHSSRVAGYPYQVKLLRGSDCDRPLFTTDRCLLLTVAEKDISVGVPLQNQSGITLSAAGSGAMKITATGSGTSEPRAGPPVDLAHNIGVGADVTSFGGGSTTNVTNRSPIAGFTFTPGQPTVNSTIHFQNDTDDLDGEITSYEWDLNGDGAIDETGREIKHSYPNPGKYTVTLTVTDDDGATANVSKTVTVAGLVYNDDVAAGDVSGDIENGQLDFSVTNHHGSTITITEMYFDPETDSIDGLSGGDFGINEIVIDGDDQDHTLDRDLEIYDGGRIHELPDSEQTEIGGDNTATFEFNGFDPDAANDDEPKVNMTDEKVRMAIHYRVAGTSYTTKFTLYSDEVTNAPPNPSFTVSCPGRACSFDASGSTDSDGTITDYEWTFGDGSNATGETTTHTFGMAGTYDVSLTVTDDNETTATLTKAVTVGGTGQWYDIQWGDRKPIEIDHTKVAGDLTGFPVMIDVTDPNLVAEAQNDGDDILFTASNGITKLDHEIETYDDATGGLLAWVNVSELSASSNTTIFMYYDNPSATDQENPEDVWGGAYQGVWHLNESLPDDHEDSTANDNDGTSRNFGAGDGSTDATGVIDGADELDGDDDFIETDDDLSALQSTATLSAWIYVDETGDGNMYEAPGIAGVDDTLCYNTWYGFQCDSQGIYWGWIDETGHIGIQVDEGTRAVSSDPIHGAWHHVALTRDATTGEVEVYVDGVRVDTETSDAGTISETFAGLGRIRDLDGDHQYFDGKLDEIRISDDIRASEWIATTFSNQNDPSSFYAVGDEQSLYEQSGGEVAMEAEHYAATEPGNDLDIGPSNGDDMSDQTWSVNSDPTASGTALRATPNQGDSALNTQNGERLDYYLNFSRTGTHYVWVRMKCSSPSDDAVHVGIDQKPTTYNGSGLDSNATTSCADGSGWQWNSHASTNRATITVNSADPHVVNVWMMEDGVRIDKILVTDDASFVPTGTGPAESPRT